MTELFTVLVPIALIDSASLVPISILPLIILLTSQRPVINTLSFILGILVVYIPFGLLLTFGMNEVFDAVGQTVSEWINKKPDCIDLLVQFIIGIALLVLSRRIAQKRVSQTEEQPELVVTPGMTFVFAVVLMATGLWGALPYFAAVDQILRAEVSNLHMVLGLLFYNVIFILPLIVLFFTGMLLGPGAKQFLEKIAEFVIKFGRQLIIILLFLLGLLLVIDVIGWYFDHPIIPIGPYA